MNYTALIIDDEAFGAETLLILLQKYCPEIAILPLCFTPQSGIEAIKKYKPQILFLDIEMPGMNGFDMLERVRDEKFECIFTTSYNQYAINAFKYNALDYLLKPIDVDLLIQAVLKAKNKISHGGTNMNELVTRLFSEMGKASTTNNLRFSLPVGGEIYFINADEVLYFEADANYTNIYFENGKKITSSKNLKKIEENIAVNYFMRIHNSYIVNIKNISKYNKGVVKKIIMKDGKELEVSRSKVDELAEKILQFFPKLF